jgi:putative PEP-CTERM system TPR-repeat lipoprotein
MLFTRPAASTVIPVLLCAVLLIGCGDDNPQRRLASAKEYLQKKDINAAVIEIKNALQVNPDLGEARYLLGTAMLQDGNAVAAEVEFRKALAAGFPADAVVPELARSMLMAGQSKKLVDEFGGKRIGTPVADASLQTTLAAAYAALDKPDQALAALNAALGFNPGYSPALIASARLKAAARDFDAAIAVTEGVLTREPANAEAWKLKGDLLLATKSEPDAALAAYRRALQAEPKFAAAYAAMLSLLMQSGKLDEAAVQLQELKKFAGKQPQTQFLEAQLAYQRKDFKQARELSQQLVQMVPNNPRMLQLAGATEFQLGALAQAEVYLAKALHLEPDSAFARRLLVMTYLRSGQSAKAVAALSSAPAKEGIDPGLYSLAGEVYLQAGDVTKAEQYFAEALKLDPGDPGKRTALAVTQLSGSQSATAFDELQNIASTDKGITADLALISAHLRRREFDKALAAVDRLQAKQPDKPAAANLRGRIYLAQKDTAAARKSFEQALKIDPSYFAAAASLATLDVAEKKPADARGRFEALLAINPKNAQALQALAALAAANGAGKDEVAGWLNKAVEANPSEAAPRLLLIDLLLRNKDTKQALAVAQSGVTAMPNSPEMLTALGQAQQMSGELNQALSTYGKLVTMQPMSPQPFLRQAEVQVAKKDYAAAEQSFRKALELQPDLFEAQRGLVILDVQAKKYQDAIALTRAMQRQRPKETLGYMLEGDVQAAQLNWDAAAAAYRTGLQQVPSPDLATKLHAALGQAGKAGDAERFAATWMKAHPRDVAFMAYLGDAAIARRDYSAAESRYLAVLQIQPENPVILNNLAWVSQQLRKEGALAYAESANKLSPNQPAFMDTWAMLLSAKGDHAKAIELQTKAVELQPTNEALRLNLARIYLASGDRQRAKGELDTLIKLGDKHSSYAEATALLKSL